MIFNGFPRALMEYYVGTLSFVFSVRISSIFFVAFITQSSEP